MSLAQSILKIHHIFLEYIQDEYLIPNNLTFDELLEYPSLVFIDMNGNGWWDGYVRSIDTDGNKIVDKIIIEDLQLTYFEFIDQAGSENQMFNTIKYRDITEKGSDIFLNLLSINDDGIYESFALDQFDPRKGQTESFIVNDSDDILGYDLIRDFFNTDTTPRKVEDFTIDSLDIEYLKKSLFSFRTK